MTLYKVYYEGWYIIEAENEEEAKNSDRIDSLYEEYETIKARYLIDSLYEEYETIKARYLEE